MARNKLKLTRDGTELRIDSKHLPCPLLDNILVGNCRLRLSNTARNIGVVVAQTLSLDKHVNFLCKSALFHLRNIGLGSI